MQHRTYGRLFGDRSRADTRPKAKKVQHQLGFGSGFTRRTSVCVGCGADMRDKRECEGCGAYVCSSCDQPVTANGGDGYCCYQCMVALKGQRTY